MSRDMTILIAVSLQFRDVPSGPMPPATPKFAYGFVTLSKVNIKTSLMTECMFLNVYKRRLIIRIFTGWQHQRSVEHPLTSGAGQISVSSDVWRDKTGMGFKRGTNVVVTINLLKHGELLDCCVCNLSCLLCSVLWIHAVSDHAALGPLGAHTTYLSNEWGSWPCICVRQWGRPLQWTSVV